MFNRKYMSVARCNQNWMFRQVSGKLRNGNMVFVISSLFSISLVSYADYDRGAQAWESGSYQQAIAEWMPAANAGGGQAIGLAYQQGLVQDNVEAHKWFNLPASYGEREGFEKRDALGVLMSKSEQAEANRLAREWQPEGSVSASSPSGGDTASVASQNAGLPQPDVIRETQALLKALGYLLGPADGLWDKRTEDAYRTFLREIAAQQGVELDVGALQAEPVEQGDILRQAALAGNIAAIESALDSGADIDGLDGRGWTALMHAVNEGYVLVVEFLIAAGADVDVRAPDGATALFMSAVLSQPDIVRLLMQAGADISIRGPQGRTPAEVARMNFGELDEVLEKGMGPEINELVMGLEMVVVPEGTFMMGSDSDDADGDEQPVHEVTISHAFAVGKYEVTFAEWDACVLDGGCSRSADDEGWGRGRRPVINVSWKDAQEYVSWLSGKTGERYRLLSESEWEYVARAGTTTAYHVGSSISSSDANFDENVGKTVEVGSYAPNAFGLHDVHGNAWEWVEDCYNARYNGAPSDGSAWTSGVCKSRVLRGGSWSIDSRDLRSANRGRYSPVNRVNRHGFRVARTLIP